MSTKNIVKLLVVCILCFLIIFTVVYIFKHALFQ